MSEKRVKGKKVKLFFEVGDWERCYPLSHFKDDISEHRPEILLTEAVIHINGDGMWCSKEGEVVERGSNNCGRMCGMYAPSNGKNGRCRHLVNCYTEGKRKFKLTVKGLVEL